jgi:asparagine synthase (glutamine-hydrolysing)
MNETQHHRGPDEGGVHIEPGLGFAHRRLSIIDLSSGQQPLFNEDGTVVVTYNGEIYNFPELTEELQQAGHTFRTHCDTEVIVHAWEEWGEACVERFRGMFAFGVWDRNRETLFLARDRLGIKPVYYSLLPDGHLLFASELKALMAHPDLPREMDPYAVEDYFAYGYVPEPRSIFKAVHKLPPAHTLTLRRGRVPCRTRASTGMCRSSPCRPRASRNLPKNWWNACARRCASAWWRRCRWARSSLAASIPAPWWR